MRFSYLAAASAALSLAAAACAPAGEAPKAADAAADAGSTGPLPLPIPINAVMVALVDFAADGIWRPVASPYGMSPDQWLLAEQDAYNLIASTTLMTTAGTGENDAEWVKDPQWRRWAQEMQVVALEAKASIDAKDVERLKLVGDRLVEICQACHQEFKPGLPSMGITRFPIYPKRDGTLTPP
jgi:hypothetical protein